MNVKNQLYVDFLIWWDSTKLKIIKNSYNGFQKTQ